MAEDYINAFVDVFRHQEKEYIDVELEVESVCKKFLLEKKVKFCWESRVKQPNSLRTKLQARTSQYADQETNCKDIWDLVAGRIVLPRWSNFVIVKAMIEKQFDLQATTQHPKTPWGTGTTLQQRFRGYDGFHFYVKRKIAANVDFNPMIEIQVMSPFMWTFQDLHHDVEYKSLHGSPSDEETRALEYLKGIANLGELAVQNFEVAFAVRYQTLPDSVEKEIRPQPMTEFPGILAAETHEEMKGLKVLAIKQAHQLDSLLQTLKGQLDESGNILSWISSTNSEVEHNRIRGKLGKLYHQSGQWFRKNHYNPWATSVDISTLWLAGSVGTGKSSLMSNVIEWHFERIQGTGERFAYFYCTRNKEKSGTPPLEVLRSLVAQLSQSNGAIVSEVVSRYTANKCQRLDIDECSDMLVRLIKNSNPTTFIIDGLEECEDPYLLLQRLEHIYTAIKTTRFIISSRLQVNLQGSFPEWKKVELYREGSYIAADMETYITTQVAERAKLPFGGRLLGGRYPNLEQRLIQVLLDTANGMFRWVELQLEVFLGPKSCMRLKEDVITKLTRLEDKQVRESADVVRLQEVYNEVFDENTTKNTTSRYIAERLIRWIMAAKYPLNLQMLVDIASFTIQQDELVESGFEFVPVDFIRRILCNFFVTDDNGEVQFAHVSVHEYLTGRIENGMQPFSDTISHGDIAITCLSLLCHPRLGIEHWTIENAEKKSWFSITLADMIEFLQPSMAGISNAGAQNDEHGNPESGRLGFPIYSIFFWADHWRNGITERNRSSQEGELYTLYHKFIQEHCGKSLLLSWATIMPHIMDRRDDEFDAFDMLRIGNAVGQGKDPPTVLFAVCVWDLYEVFHASKFDLATLNSVSIDQKPAICVAVQNSSYKMVEALLKQGVDYTMTDNYGVTALHEAAIFSDERTTRLLVEFCDPAICAMQSLDQSTALHKAARRGRDGIVQLLLQKMQPADIILADEFGRTALYLAARNCHESTVRLILKEMTPFDVALAQLRGDWGLLPLVRGGNPSIHRLIQEKINEWTAVDLFELFFRILQMRRREQNGVDSEG